MPPVFSVVIPTYNMADSLGAALRSVVDQTFQDFEVIVVDNHSTDHTQRVVQEINDSRVEITKFWNNGVIGASRNVAINASRGKYVAFLDSDDTWYKNKLERIAEAIQGDLDVGLVCHNQLMVRDGQEERRTNFGPPPDLQVGMYDYQLRVGNGPVTSATVVARRYLDEVGHFSEDPALISVEDVDLWIRLSKVCRFRFLPEVLGVRNFHSLSATANFEMHLQALLTMLGRHYRGFDDGQRSYPRRAVRRHFAQVIYNIARDYQRQRALTKSLGCYARSLGTYPFQLKAYGGMALLLADSLLGRSRRERFLGAISRKSGSWD